MRIAALILGILGGLAGIGGAVFVLFFGGAGAVLAAEGAFTVVKLGVAAVPLSILGLIGGALALAKPKVAGVLMLISAFGGLIAISMGYAVAFILLLVGAVFAFVGRREAAKQS
ncbi:MAG: hypothetical protein QME70_09585 [Bacillota bacterium]|nr:hypothetical protein [Bacillota bacterium]